MFELLIKSFWFLLPAAFANMSPVLFRRVPFFNTPVDFSRALNGKRIFGDHKTWRGLITGILMAMFIVKIQTLFYPSMRKYSLLDYGSLNVILWGFIFGAGALGGDLIKSFIKRRLDIAPGHNFVVFDQLDWILGALFLSNFFLPPKIEIVISSVLLFGLLHPVIKLTGCCMGLK